MATAAGMITSCGAASSSSFAGKTMFRGRNPSSGVRCAYGSAGLREHYRMLRIQPGASETEVKKAFRKLVLQFHPDVCKGNNCGVQFHRINEAYDIVMDSLRRQAAADGASSVDEEPWEEWMGFEGACTASYWPHGSPYI